MFRQCTVYKSEGQTDVVSRTTASALISESIIFCTSAFRERAFFSTKAASTP